MVGAIGAAAGFEEALLFEVGKDGFEEFLGDVLAPGDVGDADGGTRLGQGEIEDGAECVLTADGDVH
jgi:hypothetical protein